MKIITHTLLKKSSPRFADYALRLFSAPVYGLKLTAFAPIGRRP